MGLAIMTKGPVAFLIFGLTFLVWLAFRRFRMDFRWKDVCVYIAVLALVGGSWFLALAASGHADVIKDFIDYQIRLFETKDAGHGGFLLYHFVILLVGAAPASVFAIPALLKMPGQEMPGQAGHDAVTAAGHDATSAAGHDEKLSSLPAATGNLHRWMLASFWVVLILFTIVRTKIVHYSSFCYFPLSYLAACTVSAIIEGKMRFKRYQQVLLIGISVFFGVLLTFLTFFDSVKDAIAPCVNDPFAVSCMEATADWNGFEPVAGLLLIVMTAVFCIIFRRRPRTHAFIPLAAGNLLFLMTVVLCGVSEVEKYSQASAIDFYIQHRGENCYVKPAYFKSYAHYFYTDRQPSCKCDDMEWLGKGPVDKPCYFVVKDDPKHIERLAGDVPEARFLYKRSGFVFFVRERHEEQAAEDQHQGQQTGVEQQG